jgi:pyroglutamyl-peptidase
MPLVATLVACAAPAATSDPNAGLLRDFLDGKFDGAGHPINARVTDAAVLCPTIGSPLAGTCHGSLPGAEQSGSLVVSARIRVAGHATAGDVVTIALTDASGASLATDTLTVTRLRDDGAWIDLPLTWSSDGGAVDLAITPATGAFVELDYVEVFPQRFGLVLSPGSGVFGDGDDLTFELPPGRAIEHVEADGVDLTDTLTQLLADDLATTTTTSFRTLVDVSVADLIPDRGAITELKLRAGEDTARLQLRAAAADCTFEGDPSGTKVLVTGFQPFPADGTHDNVSGVAVTAMTPAHLHGARVMRLVLPVEYDRAAAAVADAIARCEPAVVISFGQGGGEIALEETAYNLQDTGEVSGGVPDNRGVIRAAVPIDPAAPATRATKLPLDAIQPAIEALGETPQRSTDPGRYVCNNVMFADLGAIGAGRAGFIHLPYTEAFDDAVRARFAKVVEAAIQAAVDAP